MLIVPGLILLGGRPDLVAEAVDAWRSLSHRAAGHRDSAGLVRLARIQEGAGSDKKQEKVFTGVDADKVDQVTIKSEKGERTTVAETGRQVADHRARGQRLPTKVSSPA